MRLSCPRAGALLLLACPCAIRAVRPSAPEARAPIAWRYRTGVQVPALPFKRPSRALLLQRLDPMNHAARFLTDAETICREIPRERIELLVDGLAQVRERGGRLFLLGVGGSA